MKRLLLLKSLFLLCALVVGSSAWATDLTLDLSSNTGWTITSSGTSGTGSAVEMSKDGITITANKGYWDGTQLRVYSGSSFSVTSSIGNMSKIALTYTGGKTGPLSGYSEGTATVSPAAASFASSASGQARIVKIVITYTAGAVANPIFDPAAGAVEKGTAVSITTSTDGANIYYTTDGTTPSSTSTQYSSPLTINNAQTIKAIAIKESDESEVITAAYTIKKVETPTFNVAEGDIIKGTTVEIETATAGATIHYTTDGSDPTASSTTYSSAITIDADMTIKAIAVKDKWDDSDIANATYTVITPIQGYSIDFEVNDISRYVDWTFTNIASASTAITAHGGTYYGNTDGKASASITTKDKIAYPGTFTCYISKESKNTTDSNWKVQTSENGSSWTDVATISAIGMSKGVWQEFTADLSAYKNVYVRLYYTGSTAIRAVDDIELTTYVPVTIASSGYSTLGTICGLDFAKASPEGLEAYVVPTITASAVSLSDINEAPASTGVVLKGTPGETYTIPVKATAAAVGTNYLKAAVTATTLADGSFYIMKGGKFCLVTGAENAAARTVPAGKAYLLATDVPSEARELNFVFDDVTAIETVKAEKANNEYYNLAGQRVANPTKGLYIVNGHKVIIK